MDESWQCTYADLGALGAMAKQVVCVGDPGQIDRVVTGDVSRWEGSETAPDLPAPISLRVPQQVTAHRVHDAPTGICTLDAHSGVRDSAPSLPITAHTRCARDD